MRRCMTESQHQFLSLCVAEVVASCAPGSRTGGTAPIGTFTRMKYQELGHIH